MKHTCKVKEVSYMIDQAFCSCGWTSSKFWDGAEYAHDEWLKHKSKYPPSSVIEHSA